MKLPLKREICAGRKAEESSDPVRRQRSRNILGGLQAELGAEPLLYRQGRFVR